MSLFKPADPSLLRHSTAHVLAAALVKLYPDTQLATGPATDDGFYYDLELSKTLSSQDFGAIEQEMRRLINLKIAFKKRIVSPEEARSIFKNQKYKLEIIDALLKEDPQAKLSIYETGNFIDLCSGPHLKNTSQIKADAFKLTTIAGAYFQNDESKPQLQRLYGVVFNSKEELKDYFSKLEEAKKRDHRKLGKELDLFSISPKVGPGLILWHTKLSQMREVLETWWRELHRKNGYTYIYTPHIGRAELWETSGHLGFFKDSMFPPFIEKESGDKYYVKPMSCPFHVEIYKSHIRSYRELPILWNELGTCYRFEKSGELHGLARPRGFTQDDAHVICTKEQFRNEYRKVIEMALKTYAIFDFNQVKYCLALRDPKKPDDYIGDPAIWELAQKTIEELLQEKGLDYEKEEGGAKFYGPALDMKIFDSLDREWQCATIQLDMNLPAKFNMTYIDKDGKEATPIMIHRALFGSIERFCAILIEHHAGDFPVWFAPIQIAIIPVSEKFNKYAQRVKRQLNEADLRSILSNDNDSLGKRIRLAEKEKIPYMLIVGEKEVREQTVALRERDEGDLGQKTIPEVVNIIKNLTPPTFIID